MEYKKLEITFRNLQKMVEEPYIKCGFKNNFELTELMYYLTDCGLETTPKLRKILNSVLTLMDVAEVGLIGEEVGELLEAIRKDYPMTTEQKTKDVTSIGEECADIVIRVMNFCNRRNIDLQEEIGKKNKYNMTRTRLHGKRV